MQYTILGRTGLQVSRMGLGCGGPSRLGLKVGGSETVAEIKERVFQTIETAGFGDGDQGCDRGGKNVGPGGR